MDHSLQSVECKKSAMRARKSMGKNAQSSSIKNVGSSSDVVPRATRKKNLWTIEEDTVLMDYVKKYGERNWSSVQRVTGLTRPGKSCRLRWRDQLHPGLNKLPFTLEEEKLIVALHSQIGNKWSVIAEFMPGRTDNSIKNYWYNRRKRYRVEAFRNKRRMSRRKTMEAGLKANEPDLSPEQISGSELSHLDSLSSTGTLSPEGVELSSIQHLETPRGFSHTSSPPLLHLESFHAMPNFSSPATDMFHETYSLDPISSTNRELIVEQSDVIAFPECNGDLVDPLLTDGDIVDMWLNESRDQESAFQEAIYADDDAIGNISAATTTATTDDVNVLPAWLNSPGLDEFLEQEPIWQHTLTAEDGGVNNVVAATEEHGSCFDSFLGQESLSQAVGCENGENMIDAVSVNQPSYQFNSPSMDDFLVEEPLIPEDAVIYPDYGATDAFAASSMSNVTDYGWVDETSDFWSTPFVTQIA